jgi:putative transposase
VGGATAACNPPEYASLPPSQILPQLADKGLCHDSESSFYRVLRAHDQAHHHGRSRVVDKPAAPVSYVKKGPNQAWILEIIYCRPKVRGLYYYLNVLEDIYSRKIAGWEVHERETGSLAAELLQTTVLREPC